MNAVKASNAIVATTDFYATALAELQQQVAQKDEIIQTLGEEVKRRSGRTSEGRWLAMRLAALVGQHARIPRAAIREAIDEFERRDRVWNAEASKP